MVIEQSRSRSPRRTNPAVEAFLRQEPDLEERAREMLRSRPKEVQDLVMKRGGLAGTRNPTAVLVSRIRNAEEGLKPVTEDQKASEVVERFLAIEKIEAHAAARLRKSSKAVQEAVVARGSMMGTRDPTAVLMTRIKEAEKEFPPEPKPSTPSLDNSTELYNQMMQQSDYALAYMQYQQFQASQVAAGEAYVQATAAALQAQHSVPGGDMGADQLQAVHAAQAAHAAAAAGYGGYAQVVGSYGQMFGGSAATPDATGLPSKPQSAFQPQSITITPPPGFQSVSGSFQYPSGQSSSSSQSADPPLGLQPRFASMPSMTAYP